MTPTRDLFSTYKLVHKGSILMGNNSSCKVAGIGIVHIKMCKTRENLNFSEKGQNGKLLMMYKFQK